MTRKNYASIAEALGKTLAQSTDSQLSYGIVHNLCLPWLNCFAQDNPLFNKKKFTCCVWEHYSVAMGYDTVEWK